MAYEIRFFDKWGAVSRTRWVEFDSDDKALEHLARLRHRGALELWREGRLLWKFAPPNAY
jgi:hypothetical protein